ATQNSYYNGSSSSIGVSLTYYDNQACVSDPLYGDRCNPPTINCLPNFM
ncbi:unnamed protein product, partial [Rotaria magnacalcarata]